MEEDRFDLIVYIRINAEAALG